VLLAFGVSAPGALVFDEVHYVPAAKDLITLAQARNLEHPPLAKLVMGAAWLVFTKGLHLVGEPAIFRLASIAFGLLALASIRAWMLELDFSEESAQAATWLTGFNFLWFVQSRTAMLDIFYVAFALWGLLFVCAREGRRTRYWWGWALLGLATASKWATAPFLLLAVLLARRSWRSRLYGLVLAGAVYAVTFVPVLLAGHRALTPLSLLRVHLDMLDALGRVPGAHPYSSSWWQWPTLARPIWYALETTASGQQSVWASGNPALYWVSVPLFFAVVWAAARRKDRAATFLALLYWVPLLFWALAPRRLQLYYYYLAPSLMAGPILVWAFERLSARFQKLRGWMLGGFVVVCGAFFFYFLPLMDGRSLPPGRYASYMWLRGWI
jgi:dolichyl-phosphate-mannose--protein O-mannosyl transferase